MINLYQWPSDGKLPNAGFFCMKLESYLKLQKIEYKSNSVTTLSKSPKRTMPYIEKNGVIQSDSQLIIEELENQSQEPLNKNLTDIQKSQTTSFQMMLENHLIPIIVYFRWYPESGWNQFSKKMFFGAPAIVRVLVGGMLRKKQLQRMHLSGLSRHTADELVQFAKKDLEALSVLLGNNSFYFNNKPSMLDIVSYTTVCNILMAGVDMPLIAEVKKINNLVEHSDRMLKLVFNRNLL